MYDTTDTRVSSSPQVEARRAAATGRLSPGTTLAHAGAWVASLIVLEVVSPAPDPTAVMSASALALSTAFTLTLGWLIVGLVGRARHGLGASILGGGLLAVGAVMCSLAGHTGLWIPTQLVMGLGLIGLSMRALRS